MRGMMSTIAVMSYNFGIFIVLGFGLMFSWRHVAFICAFFPLSCLVAVLFVSAFDESGKIDDFFGIYFSLEVSSNLNCK